MKIDPQKYYSLGEIVREELLPDVDGIAKATRRVHSGDLKAIIVRNGKGMRYKVLGSEIIRLRKLNEEK